MADEVTAIRLIMLRWQTSFLILICLAICYSAYLWRYPVARAGVIFKVAQAWAATGRPSTLLIGDSRIAEWKPFCSGDHGVVWNVGVGGSTTQFWQDFLADRKSASLENVDVILWVGVNDILNKSLSGEVAASSLLSLIRDLSVHKPEIIVLGQIPLFTNEAKNLLELNSRLIQMDNIVAEALRNMSRSNFIAIYESFELPNAKANNYRDGIHLSNEGNRMLCEKVYGSIA